MVLKKSILFFVVAEVLRGILSDNSISSPENIELYPPNIQLIFWQSMQATLKLNSTQKVDSLTTLIVYPCDVIRTRVSINESNLQPIHYNYDDMFLLEFLNITSSKRGFEKCAYSYEFKSIGGKVFTEELIMHIEAKWLGDDEMMVFVWKNKDAKRESADNQITTTVKINPPQKKFGMIPTVALFVGFCFNIFGFSLTLKKPDVLPFFKRPVELGFLVCSQFIVWPILAFVFLSILDPPAYLKFIFISMAAASSGAFTNLFSILTRANLTLNVLSLVLSPLIGIGVTPLWVLTLGVHLLTNGYPHFQLHRIGSFPWGFFFVLKAFFLVPGALGVLGNLYFPKKARLIALVIRPLAIIFVLVMMMMVLSDHYWTLVYCSQWRIILGPVLLPTIGGLAIFTISMLIVRKVDVALTMMIQTITTNPAYGILFVIFMVPAPYKAVCIAVVMSYFYTIIVITIFTSLLRLIIRKQTKIVEFTDDEKKAPVETISKTCKVELKAISNGNVGTNAKQTPIDLHQFQI